MTQELTINFVGVDKFTISLNDQKAALLPFISPLIAEDWQDVHWYLEVYPTQYAADVDDARAERIVARLQVWGQSLFDAVFGRQEAAQLFNQFQKAEVEERKLSIASSQPEILRLPWELLCDPQGTGFIDPRAESQAILKAVEQSAPGKIVMEFLRPATLSKLVDRLGNPDLPAIDILHFDGHGFWDQPLENQRVLQTVSESSAFINQSPVTAKNIGVLTLSDRKPQVSYLLFEDDDGNQDPISAQALGDVLYQQQISLVVLSACQSGMANGDKALGCTAALLTHQGIPAVLSMTYAVLATTTERFFSKFYGEMAKGKSIGRSVATARQKLGKRQQRGLRWRGTKQINLELADWFLPAWYQTGKDIVLLKQDQNSSFTSSPLPKATQSSKIYASPPLATEGFFGRSRELWFIERVFVRGVRQLTISGFGGQGKTYLALEAGRWLCQTGMFDVLCFVDYASFQGVKPVDWAITNLSVSLEQSFIDAEAVKLGLQKQRTLLILDNLESLQPEALNGLLTVASEWSEVGETRLLLTTRDQQLNHPDYSIGQNEYLLLKGLGNEEYPEDAIHYFQGLMKLPPLPQWNLPERSALLELFKLVHFHPLSIRLVALQSKEQPIADLTKSLESLLANGSPNHDKQRSLVASLNFSLQRLDPDLLALLTRLAVFQGGAWEPQILKITDLTTTQWQQLRSALEQVELLHVDEIANVKSPFIRFHPTLTPLLWERLSSIARADMRTKHYQHYYDLSIYLDNSDSKNPYKIRLIARQELPNLLWAVKNAIADKFENAIDFVDRLNKFLNIFGLKEDRALLTVNLEQLMGAIGSPNWYLVRSNQGEQLYNTGQYAAAVKVFAQVLQELSTDSSFERIETFGFLGKCFREQGQLNMAVEYLQTAISLSKQLEQSDQVKKQQENLQTTLGNLLTDLGHYSAAQQVYENSLNIEQELGDRRRVAVIEGQLGTLAMVQGDLTTAVQKYQSALQTFQQLQEPQMEAVAWHQLGMVHQQGQQWAAADRAYRKSASINEQQGDLTGAAKTYGQLAILSEKINKLTEAENWYRKALQIAKIVGDRLGESKRLHNLANLLSNQPSRLAEAQQLAIEALAIDRTLDPAAAEIWRTYNLLAKIAAAQGENQPAQAYRQQARSTKAAFAGTQYELQKHEPLITAVVAAVADQAVAKELEPLLIKQSENGWEQLVITIRRILAGERSIEALWEDLDADDSMIIQAIIDRLGIP